MDFKKGRKHVKNVEPKPKPTLIPHYTNWVEELKLRKDRQRLLHRRKAFGEARTAEEPKNLETLKRLIDGNPKKERL